MKDTMKITITIPERVYKELEKKRGYVPRSTFIQNLVMGEDILINKGTSVEVGENRVDRTNKVGTIPSTNNKEIEDTNYEQVISAIERINDPDYQSDSEDISEVRRMVREAGLSYNEKSKALWKQDGEKWKLIKQF